MASHFLAFISAMVMGRNSVTINSHEGLEVEYYEIVDGRTLQPVDNWDATDYIVGCVTVHCGKVRLIDNIKYKE